jgi:two-component system chemotaxis response regulator CheB
VALAYGSRAIGIVLTGYGSDGTAGLLAIKRCGGLAVVQDPSDAEAADMPRSALAHVVADHVVDLDALGALVNRLVRTQAGRSVLNTV